MPIVLTREELIDLTGYRQKSKQAAWLKRNKFEFRLARNMSPRVDRTHYLSRMGGKPPKDSTTEPNWAAMENWGKKK
jgi:hypothetical protein